MPRACVRSLDRRGARRAEEDVRADGLIAGDARRRRDELAEQVHRDGGERTDRWHARSFGRPPGSLRRFAAPLGVSSVTDAAHTRAVHSSVTDPAYTRAVHCAKTAPTCIVGRASPRGSLSGDAVFAAGGVRLGVLFPRPGEEDVILPFTCDLQVTLGVPLASEAELLDHP